MQIVDYQKYKLYERRILMKNPDNSNTSTRSGDPNVKDAQTYLNAMYGHRSEWVYLEENGFTGTLVMQGIIRAFQIQNGIDVVGEVGPATLAYFKSMNPIEKMDPDGPSDPNVCILQCALFCKGYPAGGITGIYYTSGVSAVRQLQSDANIGVTGIIDWKVWAALLSFNWFTEPADLSIDWDPNIRLIQRQLNADYSDYINVRACDGIMSRETALSVLGALQAAEGILSPNDTLTNLNDLNFGDLTTTSFPGPLVQGNSNKKFNKLVQYGLYFNGYNPGNFDGIYDSTMFYAVKNFQEFYALSGVIEEDDGTVDTATMKSLLTSRGDTARRARACDCSTILNAQQIADLVAAGYQSVGRYLTGTVGSDFRPKALTVAEIDRITSAGMRIFPIYQDGGYYLDYFKNANRGYADAVIAIQAALRLGFPYGSTIYFAVDFDCLPYETESYIVDYFKNIYGVFSTSVNTQQYKIGVYGPRQVCSELFDRMLTTSSFVSDMSSGFTGNCGYPLPLNWAFDQFVEITFGSSPSFPLDKVAISKDGTKDKGCLTFDPVQSISDQERIDTVYQKYFDKFVLATVPLDGAFSYDVKFASSKILVAHSASFGMEINIYVETATTLSDQSNSSIIDIDIDENGKVKEDFKDTLDNILSMFDWNALGEIAKTYYDAIVNHCITIAEEMEQGKLILSYKLLPNSFELSVAWECNTLYLPPDGENGKSYTLTQHLGWVLEIIKYPPEYQLAGNIILASAVVAAGLAICVWAWPALASSAGIVFGSGASIAAEGEALCSFLIASGIFQNAGA